MQVYVALFAIAKLLLGGALAYYGEQLPFDDTVLQLTMLCIPFNSSLLQ